MIYEQLLANPDEEVRGTVKELAEKYDIPVLTMAGFLDGIDDSLKVKNPIEEMDENTEVSLAFDKESLYKNMVDAKADWLYNLPAWKEIDQHTFTHQTVGKGKPKGAIRHQHRCQLQQDIKYQRV